MSELSTVESPNGVAKQKPRTLKQWMESDDFRQAVAQALPKHLTPERFLRVATTALTRTPKLAQCDQASFFSSLLTLSQLGLEPDGRRAHLIPFENRKRGCTECQLIIDYRGIVELVMRTGIVSNIHADIVCDADQFDYDRGEIKVHKIDFRKPRGPCYAVYAMCRFRDGTEKCEVMNREEVEKIRRRSRASGSGPWVTDWEEMAKKTVFRRLSKWLPFSADIRQAIEADDDQYENAPTSTVLTVEPEGSRSEQLAAMLSAGPQETQDASGEEPQEAASPVGEESQATPEAGEESQERKPTDLALLEFSAKLAQATTIDRCSEILAAFTDPEMFGNDADWNQTLMDAAEKRKKEIRKVRRTRDGGLPGMDVTEGAEAYGR